MSEPVPFRAIKASEAPKRQETILTVRVKTSYWQDNAGLHVRRSIVFLKRKSAGHNFLEEDATCVGVDDVIQRITNLHASPDGIYRVELCNERRDWESGAIEEYDYRLVKEPA